MQTRLNEPQISTSELKESETQTSMMKDVQISKDDLAKKQAVFIGIILLVALVCTAIMRFGNSA